MLNSGHTLSNAFFAVRWRKKRQRNIIWRRDLVVTGRPRSNAGFNADGMTNRTDIDRRDIFLETLIVSENAVASEFGNGVSIMNLVTNAHYRLEGVARFIWLELSQGHIFKDRPDFEDLSAAIQNAYRVSSDVSRGDLESVLRDLLSAGLITVRPR